MGHGAACVFLTAMVMVSALPLLGPVIRGSDGPISRPLSSPMIIDDDTDLLQKAADLGWPGNGSLTAPYIIDGLTIDAKGKGACIYLGNISLHLRVVNCTFTGTTPASSFMPGAGLVLWDCTNVTVDNCTATGNLYGLYTLASRECILSNCTLRNTRNDIALVLSGSLLVENNDLKGSEEGLLLQSSTGNNISGNTISYSDTLSMGIYESSLNVFKENLFHNNTGEAYIYLSDTNTLDGNRFMDNDMGLKLSWSPYNTMINNRFERNSLAFYIVSSRHNGIGKCTMLDNDIGFYLYYSDHNEIKNCWIDGPRTAVSLRDSKNNLVYGCVISDTENGVSMDGDSDRNSVTDCAIAGTYGLTLNGIRLSSADAWGNLIKHNTVIDCTVGISSEATDTTSIDNNIIISCGTAILLNGLSRSNVTKNMLTDCPRGIACKWPESTVQDSLLLEGNILRNSSEFGISIDLGPGTAYDNRALEVKGNKIERSGKGMEVIGSRNGRFERNHLLSNDVGISLVKGEGDLIFNNYLNNIRNVYLDNVTGTSWNITRTPGRNIVYGPYLGGNYWSDYNGSDLDGDGLGDELVPFGPGDHHPLVRDTFTPDITDLTNRTPETGGTFALTVALFDRPEPQDLEVDLDYEITGPDGSVVVEGIDVGQKHWKETTYSKVITVPESAVLLRYRFRATDRGGNSEGIYNELDVRDTIAPNATLRPAGRAQTGEDLVLNLTVSDNTYLGRFELIYWEPHNSVPLGNIIFDLENRTGTRYLSPVIEVPADLERVLFSLNGQDKAGNHMEEVSLILNVSDTIPPQVGSTIITPLDQGLKLSFRAVITDNVGVDRANLTVFWSGGRTSKVSLSNEGMVWSMVLDVPLDAVRAVWKIEAWDREGNMGGSNGSPNLHVPMTVISDLTTGTPMTGRTFRLAFEEMSNLVVSSRTISWWFETGPVNRSSGALNRTIMVPPNARTLMYSYRIADTYGVGSEIFGEINVLDVIPPVIRISAGVPSNDEAMTVRWSVSDNIAVKESHLRFRFDGSNWTYADTQDHLIVVTVPLHASVMELEGSVTDDALIENVSALRLDVLDPIPPEVTMFDMHYDPKNDTVRLRARFQDNRAPGTALVNWSKGGVEQGRLDLNDAWYEVLIMDLPLEGYRGEVSFKVVLIDRSGNRVEPPPFSVVALDGRHNNGDGTYLYLMIALVVAIIIVLSAVLFLWSRQRNNPPAEE